MKKVCTNTVPKNKYSGEGKFELIFSNKSRRMSNGRTEASLGM
jgi:hypothetical protein